MSDLPTVRVLCVKSTTMNLGASLAIALILPIAGLCFPGWALPGAHAAEPLEQFPVVITCEYKGLHQAFYFARSDSKGVATYVNPSRLAGTITVGGTAKALGEPVGGSCLGKTLEELRASGQARDLGR